MCIASDSDLDSCKGIHRGHSTPTPQNGRILYTSINIPIRNYKEIQGFWHPRLCSAQSIGLVPATCDQCLVFIIRLSRYLLSFQYTSDVAGSLLYVIRTIHTSFIYSPYLVSVLFVD